MAYHFRTRQNQRKKIPVEITHGCGRVLSTGNPCLLALMSPHHLSFQSFHSGSCLPATCHHVIPHSSHSTLTPAFWPACHLVSPYSTVTPAFCLHATSSSFPPPGVCLHTLTPALLPSYPHANCVSTLVLPRPPSSFLLLAHQPCCLSPP